MILDVVGAGWPVVLNNVTARVNFPAPLDSYQVYSGGYSSTGSGNVVKTLSNDRRQITLQAEQLSLVYNDTYEETMAKAITLEFVLPQGALQDFTSTRMLTGKIALFLLLGGLSIVASVLIRTFLKGNTVLTPVVNLKAPKDMDPMQMGLHIDGVVDGEDVTSMIYYFASKGYLLINLEDESDPVLIRKVVSLPENTPAYAKTIFDGLFNGEDCVSVSSLTNKFYQYSDSAMLQINSKKKKHYTTKSVLGFLLGGVICLLLTAVVPLLVGLVQVGGGYAYSGGLFMAIPALALIFVLYFSHTHQHKWGKKTKTGVKILLIVGAVLTGFVYAKICATHILTDYEKYVLALCALICPFITVQTLSYTEEYNQLLGDILGFKDFIVVTEEDKIKFMLQENPELYYDILPYAQVLGVTNEWENKFSSILLQPPTWYVGGHTTVFDYMVFNRCMRSMSRSMLTRPQQSSGVGRSGGGGSFGGFSGGGHGGGGGGAR